MNMGKLRAEASNVLMGRLFETLAFCVMHVMLICAVALCVGGLTINLWSYGNRKMGISIVLIASVVIYALSIVGKNRVMLKVVNGDIFYFLEMFSNFKYGLKAFGIIIVCSISSLLWSMLFIIPGISKAISYSMSLYVLAQNPQMSIIECINESKRIMEGYKGQFAKMILVVGIKFLTVTGILVTPYVMCMMKTTDIIVLMIVTFAFVIVYPVVMFVILTYAETMLALFYGKINETQSEFVENVEVITENIGQVTIEVA